MDPEILDGRYELLERVGSGGMAEVLRARDRSLGRQVAIKILHPHLARDPAFVERFRREARSAAALSHPNVVSVYDTGTAENDRAYIVMEFVDGWTLHDALRDRGPLPVAEAARVARHVLRALGHAHDRGLVHRDVKPGNILITPDGDVKVADFGIAKGLEDAGGLTQTGTLMGTASYLSPEQASGGHATPASDLYAMGIVLYECLTGAPPYRGDSPVAVAVQHQRAELPPIRGRRRDVPAALASVIERALEKDPARRYSSAAEMDAAIAATGVDRQTPTAASTVVIPPDAASTAVIGRPEDIAPTQAVSHRRDSTQVLATPAPPPDRAAQFFKIAAVLLLVAAAAWGLAFALTTGSDTEELPLATTTPLPTPEPTPQPTQAPTPEPTPEPTATPEPTEEPTTPRPPRTPDFDENFPFTPTPDSQATPQPTFPPFNDD